MTPPPPAHEWPLPPAVRTATGVRVLRGVRYAAVDGVRPLELDLYLPPEPRGRGPAVVHLHGGAWRRGSRSTLAPTYADRAGDALGELAAAGLTVASIDYRLSGEAAWPAPLHDAKAAVRWLRSRAAEVDVDPERIGAGGESAGGHLALLLGLSGSDLDGDLGATGVRSDVAAVVAWFPPTDLLGMPGDRGADPTDATTPEALLLGAAAETVPDHAREASPLTHVGAHAPPVLLLHGDADRVVPLAQSERLAAALRAAGADVELVTYTGADHVWLGSADAFEQALQRTHEHLLARL